MCQQLVKHHLYTHKHTLAYIRFSHNTKPPKNPTSLFSSFFNHLFKKSSLTQLAKNAILFFQFATHTHKHTDLHSLNKLSLSHVVGAKKEVFIAHACVYVCVCARESECSDVRVCACVCRQGKDHETHLRQMSESDKPPLISERGSF